MIETTSIILRRKNLIRKTNNINKIKKHNGINDHDKTIINDDDGEQQIASGDSENKLFAFLFKLLDYWKIIVICFNIGCLYSHSV